MGVAMELALAVGIEDGEVTCSKLHPLRRSFRLPCIPDAVPRARQSPLRMSEMASCQLEHWSVMPGVSWPLDGDCVDGGKHGIANQRQHHIFPNDSPICHGYQKLGNPDRTENKKLPATDCRRI